jgi:hypothetical protein
MRVYQIKKCLPPVNIDLGFIAIRGLLLTDSRCSLKFNLIDENLKFWFVTYSRSFGEFSTEHSTHRVNCLIVWDTVERSYFHVPFKFINIPSNP